MSSEVALSLCVYGRVYVCVWPTAIVHMWKSKDNLGKLIFSFYYVCPGDQTQVVELGSKFLYMLSHLIGPKEFFDYIISDSSYDLNV